MIYIVRKCYKYDSQNIRCATNNLCFAEEIFDKEVLTCDIGMSYEWVELICFDGQKHYEFSNHKTIKTTYKDS